MLMTLSKAHCEERCQRGISKNPFSAYRWKKVHGKKIKTLRKLEQLL